MRQNSEKAPNLKLEVFTFSLNWTNKNQEYIPSRLFDAPKVFLCDYDTTKTHLKSSVYLSKKHNDVAPLLRPNVDMLC